MNHSVSFKRGFGPLLAIIASLTAPAVLAHVTQTQINAAEATAQGASCDAADGFYWEVGDKTGVSASGERKMGGGGDRPVMLASASKMLFSAYVMQLRGGYQNLSAREVAYLTMKQGYTTNHCFAGGTVLGCFQQHNNDVQSSGDVNKFYYNGGQFQALAALDLDKLLANDDNDSLAGAISMKLGMPANILSYTTPTVGDGARMAPTDYGAFLRQILDGSLQIKAALGRDAVCTTTRLKSSGAPVCPSSAYMPPLPDDQIWKYSLGHWVEKDPNSSAGDGAFTSPGEHGFYPWIDATQTYYGIVSRTNAHGRLAYESAITCGQAIRKAFVTGVAQ